MKEINYPNIRMILKHESGKKIQKENTQKSLGDCLSLFLESEYLEGEDQKIYCSNCRSQNNFFKQYKLDRLPPILIISLKRFKFAKMYKTKIENLIDFPIYDLDLSELCGNENLLPEGIRYKYDLFGIIVIEIISFNFS